MFIDLRRRRDELKFTLRDLSTRYRVSNAYLSQVESNPDRLINASWWMVHTLAKAYRIPFDQLNASLIKRAIELHMLLPEGQEPCAQAEELPKKTKTAK